MSLTLRQQFGGHGRQSSGTAIADLLPPQQARSFTQQPACPPGPPLNADALCGPTFNIAARPPPAGGAAPAAPPSAPAGSPRLAGLGGGDSLLLPLTEPDGEDDDCGDAEAGGGRPWFAQWAFWLPALSCSFGVALAFAGVTSLTVSPEKCLFQVSIWRWELLAALLPAMYWAPAAAVFLLLRVLSWRLFTASTAVYFLMGTKNAFTHVLRAGLLLAAFGGLVRAQPGVEGTVQAAVEMTFKLLGCLCLCTVAHLLQKLVSKLMAIHFHQSTHFERLQNALKQEYYLMTLCQPTDHAASPSSSTTCSGSEGFESGAPARRAHSLATGLLTRVRSLKKLRTFSFHVRGSRRYHPPPGATLLEEGREPSDAREELAIPEDVEQTQLLSQPTTTRSVTSQTSRQAVAAQISELVPLGTAATAAAAAAARRLPSKSGARLDVAGLERLRQLEQYIRKNNLRANFANRAGRGLGSGSSEREVQTQQEAHELAFYLFHNLRQSRKRNHLIISDLECLLPPDQARECFAFFDPDGNGRCSLEDLRAAVSRIYQDRKHLALTLRDTTAVISRLKGLLGAVLHTLFAFAYLAIFGVNVTNAWLTFSSVVLAFAFVFGNSIRTVYECVVWLFVVHPFDVGDTLLIEGQRHKVEEIALLSTTLLRADGARVCWPNPKLAADGLLNLSRSENRREAIRLRIEGTRPPNVVERLAAAVAAHLQQSPAEFVSDSSAVTVVELQGAMLGLLVQYTLSHSGVEAGRAHAARSGLLLALDQALTAMGVAAHHLAAVPSEMEDGGGGDSCRQQGGSAPEEEWARLGALGMADGGLG